MQRCHRYPPSGLSVKDERHKRFPSKRHRWCHGSFPAVHSPETAESGPKSPTLTLISKDFSSPTRGCIKPIDFTSRLIGAHLLLLWSLCYWCNTAWLSQNLSHCRTLESFLWARSQREWSVWPLKLGAQSRNKREHIYLLCQAEKPRRKRFSVKLHVR